MGDGFDLNKHAWVEQPATTTIVAAGEFSAKTSPWARPTCSQCSGRMRNIRVWTTCDKSVPAPARTALILRRASCVCAYGSSPPMTAPELSTVVPATKTRLAAVLGGASIYEINLERGSAALGYWLAPRARGRGVASCAVRLLAQWGFTKLGLARIELTCGPDNKASQRVAGRCGFVHEGVMRSHTPFKGARRDTVIFSLLPGELR
jgi:hypothetical protein